MATAPDSGTPTPQPFAWFDPASCSWRTCQASLLEASGESCTTWPKQGTWDLGYAYELPTSAPPTAANASSSLLPTPSAEHNDGQNPELFLARRERVKAQGINGNGFGLTLGMAVQLLPTPMGQDAANTAGSSQHERNSDSLNVTVAKLLPTPHVEMSHESGAVRDWGGDLTAALSGASTSPPSAAGNTPSDDPPPGQLTIGDG